jgi:hypothetical protein
LAFDRQQKEEQTKCHKKHTREKDINQSVEVGTENEKQLSARMWGKLLQQKPPEFGVDQKQVQEEQIKQKGD